MMLFIAIPNFEYSLESGDIKKISRWILVNVRSLKGKAVSDQKMHILRVRLDTNSFILTNESDGKDEFETAASKEYRLPPGITVMDVEYPGRGAVTTGGTDINFYRKGYSDKAIIHIQDQNNNILSFLIEPFLPKVKIVEEYISFIQ